MTRYFDLNTDTMPRHALVANYLDAVALIDELKNYPNERLQPLKDKFKLTQTEAIIVNMLLTGRECSHQQIEFAVGTSSEDPCTIENVHAIGYRITKENVAELEKLAFGKPPVDGPKH